MKLNFFAKIYLAITDFRLYPYVVQKEKFINALAYFVAFIMLVSAILATNFTTKFLNWTEEFLTVYNNQVSEFQLVSGELVVEENMDFEFNGVKIYTDDTSNYEDFNFNSFDTKGCRITILGLKDAVAIGNESGYVLGIYTDDNFTFNKAEVYNFLNNIISGPAQKLFLGLAVFSVVFVAYLISKFINLLGISVILLLLGSLFRIKYKFKNYIKVACYVITLPIITEILALIVTGAITGYSYITYYLLVYVYMYYAIRALKLDNILMTAQEKMFGMKMKDNTEVNKENTDEEKQDENKEAHNKDERTDVEENKKTNDEEEK